MKHKIIILLFVLICSLLSMAQVGIGTATPNANSAFEISSTSQGMLFPRMTAAQRDAISSPAKGLTIYNTDINLVQTNIGTSASPNWKNWAANLILHLDAGNASSYAGTGTTWTDLSGLGNNGTLVNGPTYSSADGGAIVFDGVDDYVNCGTPSIGSGKITVNAWVKITTGSIFQHIVDCGSDTWHLAILNNNRPYFYNGSQYHTDASILNVGQWYMLTGVQGTTLDIYINGVLNKSIASDRTVSSNTLNLGRAQGFSRPLTGNISQVSIYRRALAASEIAQIFNDTKARFGL
jgi:hypothetical protein